MPTAKKPPWTEHLYTCLSSSFHLSVMSLLALGTSVIFSYADSSFLFHCSFYRTLLLKCWINCKYFETRPYSIAQMDLGNLSLLLQSLKSWGYKCHLYTI